ncbi:MAG: DUF1501 domain-containing protein [Phycisphaerales bacterium]|nr:DUF1501 domain-containing protein [Phycisphaerales bacterium]
MPHHHNEHESNQSTGTNDAYSRRLFMQQGMAFLSMATTVPLFMQRSAEGIMLPVGSLVSSQPGVPEDHTLVVIQLAGGNDGLNTVIPYGDRSYFNSRPQLAIKQSDTLEIPGADGFGLHPNLTGLRELLDNGQAAIIQGVGYPNPNRSHFTSTDIWHTGNQSGQGYGWLGKYFDNTCAGKPNPKGSIAIGNKAPLALHGKTQKAVNFETEKLFRWAGGIEDSSLEKTYDEINRKETAAKEKDTQLDFLVRTSLDAQVSSDRIRAAVSKQPLINYPDGELSKQLQLIGSMIRADLPTRVYYASLGGFDTHANQLNSHANLMRQVGSALNAFQNDLAKQGNTGKVITMVFSEFGRRVAQNGSAGTDHGTAAPMFLIGDNVQSGLLGKHPSLTKLDQGDLIYNTDFREVYAAVLENWMGADSKAILGKKYKKADVLT